MKWDEKQNQYYRVRKRLHKKKLNKINEAQYS